MTRSLMNLAKGRIAVILEGGYSFRSLPENVLLTLRALLDHPNPVSSDKLGSPSPEICETILNCIYTHRSYWKCLNIQDTYSLEELNNKNPQPDLHKVVEVSRSKHLSNESCPSMSAVDTSLENNLLLFSENCEYYTG